jgi:hypothetical protein
MTVSVEELGPEEVLAAASDEAPSHARAVEIWNQLTEREREAFAVLDASARNAGQYLELGKSQAALVLKRCRNALRVALADDQDAVAVVRALQRIAAGEIATEPAMKAPDK